MGSIEPDGVYRFALNKALRSCSGELMLRMDLSVAEGSRVSVIGSSGAGKSTLLRIIAGLVNADSGLSMAPDGSTWDDWNAGRHLSLQRRSVGYVSQDYALFPNLSLLDNVMYGMARPAGRSKALQWVERAGLSGQLKTPVSRLSGGQMQRAAIVRACLKSPGLLLMDEPFSALDQATARNMRRLVRGFLDESGSTMILVTHNPVDCLVLTERTLELEAGSVVADGPPVSILCGDTNTLTGTVLEAVRSGFSTSFSVRSGNSTLRLVIAGSPGQIPEVGSEVRFRIGAFHAEILPSRADSTPDASTKLRAFQDPQD